MKKIVSILISIAVLLELLIISAGAATATNIKLGNTEGSIGETVEVEIVLSGCEGFACVAVEISYDSSALSLVGFTNGSSGVSATTAETFDENPYIISWLAADNVLFNGKMGTLQFEILKTAKAGDYPIAIDYYKGREGTNVDGYHVNYDGSFNSLNMTYTNGQITVAENPSGIPSGAYVSAGHANGKVGETVAVPINLNNCAGFSNLAIEIGYDSSALALVGVTSGSSGATETRAETFTALPYNIAWDSTANTVFSGTMATLHFEILNAAELGKYPITVDYYKGRNGTNIDGYHVNYDKDFSALHLSYVAGSVTVKPEKYTLSAACSQTDAGIKLSVSAHAPAEPTGSIMAAMYDGHVLKACKIQDSASVQDVLFTEQGDLIKVMWWNGTTTLAPLCEEVELTVR